MTSAELNEAIIEMVDAGKVIAKLDGVTLTPLEHWCTMTDRGDVAERIVYSLPS